MGTRSTTNVYRQYDEHPRALLLTVYRQFDGYFEGHGTELAEFLCSRPVVNGIGRETKVFNGPGCLAAQLVAMLKSKDADLSGGYFINVPSEEHHEEYGYDVIVHVCDIGEEGSITMAAYCGGKEPEWSGPPSEFAAWVASREECEDDK